MPGSATGVPISPEEAEWRRRVTIHIGRAWVRPGFAGKAISSEVRVQIDAGGQVLGEPRLTRRSGNPWFDDDALRAAQRASPLPPPPSPGEYTIVFSSEDF
jgi:protein TonB